MKNRNQEEGQDQVFNLILAALALNIALGTFARFDDLLRSITAIMAQVIIAPFAWLANHFDGLNQVPVAGEYLFAPSLLWYQSLPPFSLVEIGLNQWLELQITAGRAASVLFSIPMFIAMIQLRVIRIDLKFRSRHNLDSLIDAQSYAWPLIRIVKNFNVLSARINPWKSVIDSLEVKEEYYLPKGNLYTIVRPPIQPPRMEIALRPELWLACQRLVKCHIENDCFAAKFKAPIKFSNNLSKESLSEVFESQLGPKWKGFDNLSPVLQGLAAIFTLGYAHRTIECEQLMEQLSKIAETSTRRNSNLNEAIRRSQIYNRLILNNLNGTSGKQIASIADKHALIRTAFMSMLLAARTNKGVLSSSSFLWLKQEDRTLWYALNSVGNNITSIEAAGVAAHYRAELQSRQILNTPIVGFASKSLLKDYLGSDQNKILENRLCPEFRKPVGIRLSEAVGAVQKQAYETC